MSLEAINLGKRLALTHDQRVIPITNLFDSDGDDTDKPEEAVTFVAGPLADGSWLTDEIGYYDYSTRRAN